MISRRSILVLLPLLCLASTVFAGSRDQSQSKPDSSDLLIIGRHKYTLLAAEFLKSLTEKQKQLLHYGFNDTLRQKWQREPGNRSGVKLSDLTEDQKVLFHRLLRSGLSMQGYLKVTAEMFNEDIQKKVEPNLGRNEFWVEIFGNPAAGETWGWKLEGHHLTVNMTLKGDKVIANTPFLIGSNPANSRTDTARAGLTILSNEDELAIELINSLDEILLKAAYTAEKRHNIVYGETDEKNINVPENGLYINQMTPKQQAMLRTLLEEYMKNFNPGETPPVSEVLNSKARFFFMENRASGKEYYYRIWNGRELVECENYGNHIHCFWRSLNDFGKLVAK